MSPKAISTREKLQNSALQVVDDQQQEGRAMKSNTGRSREISTRQVVLQEIRQNLVVEERATVAPAGRDQIGSKVNMSSAEGLQKMFQHTKNQENPLQKVVFQHTKNGEVPLEKGL
ncbi:unnamed protein product [Calypogeia fissa]